MLELVKISFGVEEEGRKKRILDEVSLKLEKGEFVVITGPNGSGKSTLAQIMMGIKSPMSGRVILEKKDITQLDITERAKLGMAFSFQQPVKFKGLKVYDILNIANGKMISPEAAGKLLRKVGLEPSEYLEREIDSKLSGGELKRIEIASVLARDADLMIFDEPEAGIDLWSFENLVKVFLGLKKSGKTIVVISHQERILKIAERIVIMESGKIKKQGTAEKLLSEIIGGAR